MGHRSIAALGAVLLCSLSVSGAAAAPEGTLKELDGKKREALVHQLQRILHDQVTQAPVYHLGFPTGVGPRADDILATAIPASTCLHTKT
jgi:hypothetical protein